MNQCLHRISKFYSRIIRKNIGIFIFIGILAVLFGPQGWLPYENFYAVSVFLSDMVLPVFLAFCIGESLSEYEGGIAAVLSVTGIIAADTGVGIPGALLVGTFCGVGWKYLLMPLLLKVKAGFELLCRNLAVAVWGLLLAAAAYFFVSPALVGGIHLLLGGVDVLIQKNLLFLLSMGIEPAKILFLNNSINYGLLIPLGMEQAGANGSSILFLLETNPGPGLGILLALLFFAKEKQKENGAGILIELFGGIHEIYFPAVISNLWLVLPLVAGGMAGAVCFNLTGAGLTAPAAPGSLIAIFLVAGKGELAGIFLGIVISAAVSMTGAAGVLKIQQRRTRQGYLQEGVGETMKTKETAMQEQVHTIGFICDGGMGSSAMGASVFRRRLGEKGIDGIRVSVHAGDMVPEGLDLLICQKNYLPRLEHEVGTQRKIVAVDNLLEAAAYDALIEEIGRNKKENPQLDESGQKGGNER